MGRKTRQDPHNLAQLKRWADFINRLNPQSGNKIEVLQNFLGDLAPSSQTIVRWIKGEHLVRKNALKQIGKKLGMPNGLLEKWVIEGTPSLDVVFTAIKNPPPKVMVIEVEQNSPSEILKAIKMLFGFLEENPSQIRVLQDDQMIFLPKSSTQVIKAIELLLGFVQNNPAQIVKAIKMLFGKLKEDPSQIMFLQNDPSQIVFLKNDPSQIFQATEFLLGFLQDNPSQIIKIIKLLFGFLSVEEQQQMHAWFLTLQYPEEESAESLKTLLTNRDLAVIASIWDIPEESLVKFREGEPPPPKDSELSLLASALGISVERLLSARNVSYPNQKTINV